MRKDLQLHLVGGLAILAWATLVIACHLRYGPGPAAALATTLGAAGVEGYQRIRKAGTPDALDLAVTAAPGWVVWVVMAFGA